MSDTRCTHVLEPGELPPSPDELLAIGAITPRQHAESVALLDHFARLQTGGVLTLTRARRDPQFRAAAKATATATRRRGPRARGAGRPAAQRRTRSSDCDDGASDPPPDAPALGGLPVTLVGTPSAESDAAIARSFEAFLEAERPGTTWWVVR